MIRKLCSDSAAAFLLAAICLPATGYAGTVRLEVSAGVGISGGNIRIDDGVVIFATVVNLASVDAGPLVPGATTVFANAEAISFTDRVFAEGVVSLDRGEIQGWSIAAGPLVSFGSGVIRGYWLETVTFTNSTAGNLIAPFSWAIDGSFILPGDPYVDGILSVGPTNSLSSASLLGGRKSSLFQSRITPASIYAEDQLSGEVLSPGQNTTWLFTDLSEDGIVGLLTESGFVIPPGTHAVNISADLRVFCRSGAQCYFNNTAAFRFGDIPRGLTWTSGSGVFLSGLTAPPPPMEGVPEPAAALMVAPVAALLAIHALRRSKAPRT
jgi:hypothetical protein